MTRTCASCGVSFPTTRPNARWCSERCKKRGQRGAVSVSAVTSVELPANVAAALTDLADFHGVSLPEFLREFAEAATDGRVVGLVDQHDDSHRGWAVIVS